MARPPQLCQADNPAGQRTALSIPPEIWESIRVDVEDLYVGTTITLAQIREQIRQNYSFEATTKQWKDQLRGWHLKRYLNKTDAAHILRLIHQAQDLGCRRRVFFFSKEKTAADIFSYVRKSSSLQEESDLLREIGDKDPTPPYITYEDTNPTSVSPESIVTPALHTPGSYQSSQRSSGGMALSPYPQQDASQTSASSYQQSPNWQIINASDFAGKEPSPLLHAVSFALDEEVGTDDCQGLDLDPTFPDQSAQWTPQQQPVLLNDTQVGPGNVLNLVQPFLHPNVSHSADSTSPYFHSLMSVTPVQRLVDAIASPLSWEMSGLLRRILEDNSKCEQLSEDIHTASFLINSIQGCILRNQGQAIEAQGRFAAAAANFEMIIAQQPEDSLTAVGSLLALLESYGQRMAAREILTLIFQTLQQNSEDMSPFTATLHFMWQTQLPDYGSKGTYDLASLDQIYRQFRTSYGPHSRLTLTAHYNIAWAYLEHEHYQIARNLLIQLKPMCETAFGSHHLQSIMAAATLARAHLHNGEHQPAQMLIKESVVCRIKEIFSESHPYYWEALFRQAAFMKITARKEENETTRQRLMQQSEKLLREVLLWRLTILGSANPRTNSTFRVLKDLLERQKRVEEASNLYWWAIGKCQQRRQELWQPDFILTSE